MSDSRFFPKAGPFSLEQVIAITGASAAQNAGLDTAFLIHDVAPLDRAGLQDISFLDNVKYIETFAGSRAGVCFIRAKYAERAPGGMITLACEDPYRCFAQVSQKFYPAYIPSGVISSHARIASTAMLGKNCTVEDGAIVGENVEIGDNCLISSGAVIRAGVAIGHDCCIGMNSTLSHCIIGNRAIIHNGVHIGQDGFGFALGAAGHIKVPQLGRVMIGDDVEIGSGTCIDRGTGPDTVIGNGSKIDNLVQIGHNVHIGSQSIVVAQTGIAGSSRIGDGVMLAGQVGIAGHLKIGHGAKLAAQSGVMTDIPAGASYGGCPAVPVKDWHRQTIALARMSKRKAAENE